MEVIKMTKYKKEQFGYIEEKMIAKFEKWLSQEVNRNMSEKDRNVLVNVMFVIFVPHLCSEHRKIGLKRIVNEWLNEKGDKNAQ